MAFPVQVSGTLRQRVVEVLASVEALSGSGFLPKVRRSSASPQQHDLVPAVQVFRELEDDLVQVSADLLFAEIFPIPLRRRISLAQQLLPVIGVEVGLHRERKVPGSFIEVDILARELAAVSSTIGIAQTVLLRKQKFSAVVHRPVPPEVDGGLPLQAVVRVHQLLPLPLRLRLLLMVEDSVRRGRHLVASEIGTGLATELEHEVQLTERLGRSDGVPHPVRLHRHEALDVVLEAE